MTDDSVAPDTIRSAIIQAIEATIAESRVERRRVLGIGVGMAGLVDGEAGVCRYSPFFGWRDVPIAAPITAHFGLPVYLENDVSTLTIAEQWFGYGHGVDHFVVVTVGRGIGAGTDRPARAARSIRDRRPGRAGLSGITRLRWRPLGRASFHTAGRRASL